MSDLGYYSNLGWNPNLFGDQTNINNSNIGDINEVNEASTNGKISTDGDLWRYNNGQVEPLNRGSNNQLLESTSNNINWTSDINVNSITTPLIQNDSYIDVESTTAKTIMRIKSNEDSQLHIISDLDNVNESDNPRLVLTQDSGFIGCILSIDEINNTNLFNIGTQGNLQIGNAINEGTQDVESTVIKPATYPAIFINSANTVHTRALVVGSSTIHTSPGNCQIDTNLYLSNRGNSYTEPDFATGYDYVDFSRSIAFSVNLGADNVNEDVGFSNARCGLSRFGQQCNFTMYEKISVTPTANATELYLAFTLPDWVINEDDNIDLGNLNFIVYGKEGAVVKSFIGEIRFSKSSTQFRIFEEDGSSFINGTSYLISGFSVSWTLLSPFIPQ